MDLPNHPATCNFACAKLFFTGAGQRFIHKIISSAFLTLILFASQQTLFAQQKIQGTIAAEDNSPLAAATILVRNTGVVTISRADGSFSIIVKQGDVIDVSFVGYSTKTITISDYSQLKIVLSLSTLALDDVVMVGYTYQRVRDITGSVAVVKPKDLISIPAGQVEQMLQGRVAGLNIITSGLPGGGSNVQLHGIGNFGDVTPLYIIDGVPGNINNLNPNDIESLQVLKDAGAYSIYGVRGANGVIVITTKNGKPGKTKVNYDFYMGTTRPLHKGLDLLNNQEMADLTWLALKNSNLPLEHAIYGTGDTPTIPDYYIPHLNMGFQQGDPATNPDLYNVDFHVSPVIYQIIKTNKEGTDWFHEFFKPAFSHSHSLAVSGSNEKNKYYLSLGYLDQQGTMINTFLKRYDIRINTQFAPLANVRIGENLQVMNRESPGYFPESSGPDDNEIAQAITTNPLMPVYDIRGGWAHFFPFYFYDNPVSTRVIGKDDKAQTWEIFGNVFAEADFLKYFTVRSSFGSKFNFRFGHHFYYYSYYEKENLPDNSLSETTGYDRSWTWTNTVKFSRVIKDHHLSALAGVESIDNYNRTVVARKTGLLLNEVNYRFLINGSQNGQFSSSIAKESSLYSLFAKADYAFNDKYFFSVTVRDDGSSVFSANRRHGWFPSVSAAWRLSAEEFMKQVTAVSELKLRASWGKTGYYGNTDPFNQYTLYGGNVADAAYDLAGNSTSPIQGFRRVQLGDPRTSWQEDVVTNIGIESVFWNGKLNITADWYNKKTNGLLFPITLPFILGGATPPNINVGEVNNRGIDLFIGTKGKFSKLFSWDAALTFTTYKNKVNHLTDIPFAIPRAQTYGGSVSVPYVRNEVGQPVSSFFGYKVTGIFQDDDEVAKAPEQNAAAPGRFRYLDANDDGVIDDNDRIYLGHANPDFTAGFNISFRYKNFDLSAFFYGSFGNEVVNVPKSWIDFYQTDPPYKIYGAKSKDALYNSWTPGKRDATVPKAEAERNFSNVDVFNSYIIEDGSYFRNKSLMAGYTVPGRLLEKTKVESIRVYVQALNLFTITKYSGLDPELSGMSSAFGIDYGNYPNNQKQYLFGVNVNF